MPKKEHPLDKYKFKSTINIVAETKCKICITLTIKTQGHCFYVSIANFEQILNVVLVFLLSYGNRTNLKFPTWITVPLNFGLLTVAFDPQYLPSRPLIFSQKSFNFCPSDLYRTFPFSI